jgi:hypothetical protein
MMYRTVSEYRTPSRTLPKGSLVTLVRDEHGPVVTDAQGKEWHVPQCILGNAGMPPVLADIFSAAGF